MTTGPVPHVGGPILPPGAPTVLVNGLPAATVTSMATCVGPPDMVVKGSTGVFINYLPAARMGDQTTHGGVIVMGSPNVIIGEIGSGAPGSVGMSGIVAGMAATGVNHPQKPNASVYSPRVRPGVPPPAPAAPALNPNLPEKNYDGVLVGKGCQPLTTMAQPGDSLTKQQIDTAWKSAYVSNSPCCQAMRASGKQPQKIVYVNGIKTDRAAQCKTLQKIADQTCAPVLGVHNSTNGTMSDLWQCKQDRNLIDQAQMGRSFATHDGRNPAVDSMSDMITNSVRSDDPTTFYAHSQGGDILALASYQSNLDLVNAGYAQGVDGVHVLTMASAGQSYPSGLVGQHFINIQDFVPTSFGLGKNPANDAANTGPNQQVIRFQGAPDATDPKFLSDQEMTQMLQPKKGWFSFGDSTPSTSMTDYHSVDTTYLNAVKKEDGGC
ncbi:MAG TPA: PAAR domain-containing protein [Granulicella sp.]